SRQLLFFENSPRKTRGLFTGSAAIFALVLSSCTSTGDGSASLQLSSGTEGSMVAEALQSAADEARHDNVAAKNNNPTEQKSSSPADEKPVQEQIATATLHTDQAVQKATEKPSL